MSDDTNAGVDLDGLEKDVQSVYRTVLSPLAESYGYELPAMRPGVTGLPTVLLLGNHSSGKSTFINHVLGSEIQKTGLAPVDDSFTIIKHGPTTENLDGHTVISHPQLSFKDLGRHGTAFLKHLCLKTRPDMLIDNIALIDSPGMIDVADGKASRTYDFTAAVRSFAELSDLIVFFFDPDKPGTTGETLKVFTEALGGMEHKLLIVLNKVDRFNSIRDFARAYGALCWNLAKVIPHKDLPHIHMIYTPGAAGSHEHSPHFPLEDFDGYRTEVINALRRAPNKRADNLVTSLHEHAQLLLMHSRVCSQARRQVWATRLGTSAAALGFACLTALIVFLTLQAEVAVSIGAGLIGTLLTLGSLLAGRYLERRLIQSQVAGLDAVFEQSYSEELALSRRDDLRSLWDQVKPRTERALRGIGVNRMPLLMRSPRARRRLENAIIDDIPALRRQLPKPSAEKKD